MENLDRLWNLFAERECIGVTWPEAGKRTMLAALTRSDATTAQRLRDQFVFVRDFAVLPVVAVAGLINSGKTSLVASLLSPTGRTRVLRGVSAGSGTQRFTLWLPGSWQERPDLRPQVDRELARIFGHAPELLAAKPGEAQTQQMRRDALAVPLLAWDEALDAQGIALLDCPDIQRRTPGESDARNIRLEMLKAAGAICAGVVLVARRTEIEVREFHLITELLPSATRVYAVNFLRRESATEVATEMHDAAGLPEGFVYAAYDYDVGSNAAFAPACDPNFGSGVSADTNADRTPFFFEVPHDAAQAIDEETALKHLGRRLGPEALRQRRQRELVGDLVKDLSAAAETIQREVARMNRVIDTAALDLFDRCHRLFRDGENLRLKIDPEIAEAMAAAIRHEAPWDMKLLLAVHHWLFRQLGRLREAGTLLAGKLQVPERWMERFREVWRSTPESPLNEHNVKRQLEAWSLAHGTTPTSTTASVSHDWQTPARDILERFAAKERTRLPRETWEELARQLWKKTPVGWTRFKVASLLVIALAALAIFPVLGGAALLATTFHTTVVALTWKELLVAAGLGALLTSDFARSFERMVDQTLGRRQIANFFAIVADRVGLPREVPRERKSEFPEPMIEAETSPRSFGIATCGWQRAVCEEGEFAEWRAALTRFHS
jgi:hypothetical protein